MQHNFKNSKCSLIFRQSWRLILVFLGFISTSATAQICVPFTQRTSQYTPTKTLYNLRGDFTMVGNTNLTLLNYGDFTQNGNNMMVYTDVDSPELTGLDGLPTFNSSSAMLNFSTENDAVPECSNIVYAGLYWTGRAKNIGPSPNTFPVTKNGITKNFDKRKIQLKGPASTQYTEFTAAANDIYFPTNAHDFMYSAYTEVTDYVKANGIGNYFAADIALIEGNGGGTGFYGGWGMIVIYENSKMKHRDITIFDGHAFVVAGNANFDIPVTSFNTVQTGAVGVKMGIMSGEGDNGISGDYFQIQKDSDGTYWNLNHSLNTANNFFNSSIQTGGNARNPNLLNNSGLDIAMFQIPNPDNNVIGNNQTATNLRYGSMGDTYIIFAVALAVDAYIPDFEGTVSVVSIDGVPPGPTPTVEPGQDIVYKVQVRNTGTETISNAKVTIPVPYNASYVLDSGSTQVFITPPPTPDNLHFEPSMGLNGSIIWDIGTLPLQADPDNLLGEFIFTLKASENCTFLKNTGCNNVIALNGELSGTGAGSGIAFDKIPLIQGYIGNGVCEGTAIPAPLRITIDAAEFITNNCPGIPSLTAFTFCDPGESVPISAISSGFPSGTFFYNQYPVVSGSTTQYTFTNPFPATLGTATYYAVTPGNTGCYFQFTITVGDIVSVPTVSNLTYCLGAIAQPLTATASQSGYTLYFYATPTSQPQLSLTPATGAAGTFTYYVAEAQSASCIGPLVPIIVTVLSATAVLAPPAATIEACSITTLLGLPVSTSPSAITAVQFLAMGGTIPNMGLVTGITYSDVWAGSCPKILTRTFTFTTSCGAPVVVTQTATIIDTTAPVINSLPAPSAVQCGMPMTFAQATATDNCGASVSLTFQDISSQGTCTGSYTMTRTWTATDSCGNVSTATQIINVTDTMAPVISPAQNITIPCGGESAIAAWLADHGGSTALGDCSQITWSNNYVPLPVGTFGPASVQFTATDACGNTASTSATATFTSAMNTPVFASIAAFCAGSTAPVLPDTSLNNVTGTWNPSAIDNGASGTYVFTPAPGQCATPVQIDVTVLPLATPTFDVPTTLCEGNSAPLLPANSEEGITGTWTPSIIDAGQTADYVFTPDAGQCATSATVSITVLPTGTTQAEAYAPCNSDIGLVIDLTASLPDDMPGGGTWSDLSNSGGLQGATFLPNGLATGTYLLNYELAGECPRSLQLEMEVDDDCAVLGCGTIIVHNALSPNNDGKNDKFIIENIEDISCYPTNSLQIYNRWQVLVYETKNYDNRTRYFDGLSEGRATVSKDSELPTGTYFYLLEYTTSDGQVIKKDGYLYLSR